MMRFKKMMAMVLAVMAMSISVFAATADYDKETVQQVQQALNDAGFDCGTPDGVAGKNTAKAISAYQEANGMTVTGEIDDALVSALLNPVEETEAVEETTPPEVEETAKVETTEAVVTTEATVETTQVETAAVETAEAETGVGEVEPFVWQDGDELSYKFDDESVFILYKHDGNYFIGEKDTDSSTHFQYTFEPVIEYIEGFAERYFYDPVYFPDKVYEDEEEDDEEYFVDDYGMGYEWVDGEELLFTYATGEVYKIRFQDSALKLIKEDEDVITEFYTFTDEESKIIREFIFDNFATTKFG